MCDVDKVDVHRRRRRGHRRLVISRAIVISPVVRPGGIVTRIEAAIVTATRNSIFFGIAPIDREQVPGEHLVGLLLSKSRRRERNESSGRNSRNNGRAHSKGLLVRDYRIVRRTSLA